MLKLSQQEALRLGIGAQDKSGQKPPRPLKKNKMNAVRTPLDGKVFDSGREARRYANLKLEQRLGLLSHLHLQVRFRLHVNNQIVSSYWADFVYLRPGVGLVVEDSKGMRTPKYIVNRKLMKAIYNIEILET